jgi:hypothetical protein
MATDYKAHKWKRNVNYIADVVSDISRKMDHIVEELRTASFNLGHLADDYLGRRKRNGFYPDDPDYASNDAC